METLRGWTDKVRTLLVILDQFEDYFLYHADEEGEGTFVEEFPAVVNDENLRVHFLVSIREDALAKLDRFKGSIPRLFANYVRVEHLDRAAARRAIEGPVDEWNRRHADEPPYTLEPGSRRRGDRRCRRRASSRSSGTATRATAAPSTNGSVEAPFLQLVMERIWRATSDAGERDLTLARLEALGGPQRIVENHLLEALGTLSRGRAGRRRRSLPLPRDALQDEDRSSRVRSRRVDRALRGRGDDGAGEALPARRRPHPAPRAAARRRSGRDALRALPRRPRRPDPRVEARIRAGRPPEGRNPARGPDRRRSRSPPRDRRQPRHLGTRATERGADRDALGDVARARVDRHDAACDPSRQCAPARARGVPLERDSRGGERGRGRARGGAALRRDGDPARRAGRRPDDRGQPRRANRSPPPTSTARCVSSTFARRKPLGEPFSRAHGRGLGPRLQPGRQDPRLLQLRRHRPLLARRRPDPGRRAHRPGHRSGPDGGVRA